VSKKKSRNNSDTDDKELIRKVAQKDLRAFQKLYERHHSLVFNTCCRLLGDIQQAEDISQEVFLRIYRSASSFRQTSKVSTWIYRIAVNLSLNIIRRNKKFRWWKSLGSFLEEEQGKGKLLFVSYPDEPEKAWQKREAEAVLKRAVDSLPEKQRVAFVLHKYEALSSQEISEILGISSNAVEVRIHRAKRNLQKKLIALLKKNRQSL